MAATVLAAEDSVEVAAMEAVAGGSAECVGDEGGANAAHVREGCENEVHAYVAHADGAGGVYAAYEGDGRADCAGGGCVGDGRADCGCADDGSARAQAQAQPVNGHEASARVQMG